MLSGGRIIQAVFHGSFSGLKTLGRAPAAACRKLHDQAARERANYEARVDLAAAYRALDFLQLAEGVCNHLTLRAPARDRDGDVMLIIPYGLHWKEVTASCLLGLDFTSGEVVEGDRDPNPSASTLHRPIHNARYPQDGITAVMHTHQSYATAIACMDSPEPFQVSWSQNSMRFLDNISYDRSYDGLANEAEEGARVVTAMAGRDVLMMGNHGVLVVGRRACDAFDVLYYLERASKVQVLLMSSGAKPLCAPDHVVKQVAEDESWTYNANEHFQSMKRILANHEPSFRS